MTQNFNNAKIYKITNDYNDEVYVGSTCDTLIKRFSAHKRDRNGKKNIHRPLYKLMNEIGIERFRIDLIEDYPCNDKQALRQREGFYIREKATLNINVAGRTDKMYYTDNAEKLKCNGKKYRDNNKEKILEEKKTYYEANKEDIKEKKQIYRDNNKVLLKERSKKNYETNKEEINRKQRENYQRKKLEKLEKNNLAI